jgi:hypothetical protein
VKGKEQKKKGGPLSWSSDQGTDGRGQGRRLIYIPILHTRTDMGSLQESVTRASLRKLGNLASRRKAQAIDQAWTEIEQLIDSLSLDYTKVRLYQDGLPVCGREADIVRELAQKGSRNHQLLVKLMEKGATLMGTESPELLVREYELAKETLAVAGPKRGTRGRSQNRSKMLLQQRDQFIARRINATLGQQETGILFLGILHSPEEGLAADIELAYPLPPPGSRQSPS